MHGDLTGLIHQSDNYGFTLPVAGTIDIGGDLSGQVILRKPLQSGRIHVRGSLVDNPAGHEIEIPAIDSNGAIAIDYDGWQEGDEWEEGATVVIGSTTYTENMPSMNIWEIQRCKGDMNNSGWVTVADFDPFLMALNDPQLYEQTYPGLEGSILWHGDCNCDGVFDSDDFDEAKDLMARECCTTDCLYFNCEVDPIGPTPLSTATMLNGAVSAHMRPALFATVMDLAEDSSDPPRAAFWGQVLTLLGDQ